MEEVYDKDGVVVWGFPNPNRKSCSYEIREKRTCKWSPKKIYVVGRYNSVLAASVCNIHKEMIIKAAKKDGERKELYKKKKEEKRLNKGDNELLVPTHMNNLLGPLELSDFFDPPPVSRVRFLDRVDYKGDSLDELVKTAAELRSHQYLVVPKEFQIVPGRISNFRKKGLFLDIPMVRGQSLRQAARLTIERMDSTKVYAGMRHMDMTDRTRREYALVTLIEGSMIQNLLGEPGRKQGLHFFDEDGEEIQIDLEEKFLGRGAFCFYVPSSSNPGESYRVDLTELRTTHPGTRRQRGRYGLRYECTCEASLMDELTGSDENSSGKPYANGKVRPCKHAYAALAYLEENNFTPAKEPRTPVKPSRFARGFNARLRTRVLHGNDHLKREEQEVILMRAIAPTLLGYDKMFDR